MRFSRHSFILILLFVLLTSISFASQTQVTTDSVFTKLVNNHADFTTGTATFEMCNPSDKPMPLDKIKINVDEYYGNEVNNIDLFYGVDRTYEKTSEEITCVPIKDDEKSVIKEQDCTKQKTISEVYKKEWDTLDKKGSIGAGECIEVKIVAKWNPQLGSVSKEWVPEIIFDNKNYKQIKWAWWISPAWYNCKNIYINETGGFTRANQTLMYTIAGLEGKQADNDDVRIVNAACGETGQEIIRDIELSGSDWVNVVHNVDITANDSITYSVYYNSTTATAPSYTDFVEVTDEGTYQDIVINDCYKLKFLEQSGTFYLAEIDAEGCGGSDIAFLNSTSVGNTDWGRRMAADPDDGLLWDSYAYDASDLGLTIIDGSLFVKINMSGVLELTNTPKVPENMTYYFFNDGTFRVDWQLGGNASDKVNTTLWNFWAGTSPGASQIDRWRLSNESTNHVYNTGADGTDEHYWPKVNSTFGLSWLGEWDNSTGDGYAIVNWSNSVNSYAAKDMNSLEGLSTVSFLNRSAGQPLTMNFTAVFLRDAWEEVQNKNNIIDNPLQISFDSTPTTAGFLQIHYLSEEDGSYLPNLVNTSVWNSTLFLVKFSSESNVSYIPYSSLPLGVNLTLSVDYMGSNRRWLVPNITESDLNSTTSKVQYVYFPDTSKSCNYMLNTMALGTDEIIKDANIKLETGIGGSLVNVYEAKTLVDGTLPIYVRWDKPYKITISKENYTSITFVYEFYQSDCAGTKTITMSSTSTAFNITDYYTWNIPGLTILFEPSQTMYNGTVIVNITDASNSMTYQWLNVTNIAKNASTSTLFFSNNTNASMQQWSVNLSIGINKFDTCLMRNGNLHCLKRTYIYQNLTGVGDINFDQLDKAGGLSIGFWRIIFLVLLSVVVALSFKIGGYNGALLMIMCGFGIAGIFVIFDLLTCFFVGILCIALMKMAW